MNQTDRSEEFTAAGGTLVTDRSGGGVGGGGRPPLSEEAYGISIAERLRWDGAAILRVASAALVDANFHKEAAILDEIELAL